MPSLPSYVNFSTFASTGHLTQLQDGNFLTLWSEVSTTRQGTVYGQIFRADGSVLRTKFTITSASETDFSDITATILSDGRIVVAFTMRENGVRVAKAQILDVHGNPTSDLLSLGPEEVTDQGAPQIYALSDGGFSALYSGRYAGASALFSSTWSPGDTWSRTDENVHDAPDDASFPTIVLWNGAYVVLQAIANGTDSTIGAYIWSPGGTPSDQVILDQIPDFTAVRPGLAPIGSDMFVAAWEDVSEHDGTHFIHTQVFNTLSNKVGPGIRFSKPVGTIEKIVITELSTHGFVIALTVDNNGDQDVYVAACDANGTIVADMAAVGSSTAGDQWNPSVIALANGHYAVSWMNEESSGYKLTTQVFGVSGSPGKPTDPTPPDTGSKTIGTEGNDMLIAPHVSSILRGFGGHDSMMGGDGNDKLYGGFGNDRMTGGAGKDVFIFNTKPDKKKNLDVIADYNVKADSIWLDNAFFKKLGKKGTEAKPAKLDKKFFVIGSKAKDKNDYLVYDKKKGVLYYDADGSGKGKAVEIAKLNKNLKMTAADFFVI